MLFPGWERVDCSKVWQPDITTQGRNSQKILPVQTTAVCLTRDDIQDNHIYSTSLPRGFVSSRDYRTSNWCPLRLLLEITYSEKLSDYFHGLNSSKIISENSLLSRKAVTCQTCPPLFIWLSTVRLCLVNSNKRKTAHLLLRRNTYSLTSPP